MPPTNGGRVLKKVMREHYNERTKLLSTIPEDSVINMDLKDSEASGTRGRWVVMLFFVATILGLACAIVAAILYEVKEHNSDNKAQEKSDWQPKGYKDMFQGTIDRAKIPGVAAAVLQNGTVVWSGSIGYADIVEQKKASVDNPFLVSYLSQIWTSVAVMILVENGTLDLDKNVSEYLDISVINPKFKDSSISLRQLLTHTSSITDREVLLWSMYFVECDDIELDEFIHNVFAQGGKYKNDSLNFGDWKPGSKFEFSSVGIALAGYVIEKVVSDQFEDWYQKNVLDVAGWRSTFWHYCEAEKAGLAVAKPHGYNLTEFEKEARTKISGDEEFKGNLTQRFLDLVDDKNGSQDSYFRFRQYGTPHYPGGGLRTTVLDQAGILCMVLNDGDMQPCGGSSGNLINRTTAHQLRELQKMGGGKSSLGFIDLATGGRSLIGSEGFDLGVSSRMSFDRKNKNGVVILSNGHLDSDEYREALKYMESFLYASIEAAPSSLQSIL